MALAKPIVVSSPGTLKKRLLPVDLADPADTLATVSATCSITGVTITAAVSDEPAKFNGETFAANRCIKFNVVALADLADQDGEAQFVVDSTGLEHLEIKKDLWLRRRLDADEDERALP